MFFAKIPRPIRQNAITEGDLECILTRNCEGTEQLRIKCERPIVNVISSKQEAAVNAIKLCTLLIAYKFLCYFLCFLYIFTCISHTPHLLLGMKKAATLFFP